MAPAQLVLIKPTTTTDRPFVPLPPSVADGWRVAVPIGNEVGGLVLRGVRHTVENWWLWKLCPDHTGSQGRKKATVSLGICDKVWVSISCTNPWELDSIRGDTPLTTIQWFCTGRVE